jgi:hypothetical protein
MNKTSFSLMLISLMIFLSLYSTPSQAESVDIHGFISQGYLKSNENNYLADTKDGTFQFNEMGINFTNQAASMLRIGCQLFARDLGDVGNDEIYINWAFADFSYRDWLGMRTGILKLPMGFYHDTRDFDSLRTNILLPNGVYVESFRDDLNRIKGLEWYGTAEMGSLGMMKYQMLLGDVSVSMNGGMAKVASKGYGVTVTRTTPALTYAGSLQWLTPVDGLRLGATYMQLAVDYYAVAPHLGIVDPTLLEVEKTSSTIFSLEYTYGDLTLKAENYHALIDAKFHVPEISMPPITLPASIQPFKVDTKDNFYLSIAYRFTEWLEAGAYYTQFINNESKYILLEQLKGDANELKDQCLSLRFDINPFWIMKLETHLMNGLGNVDPDDHGKTDDTWMLYAAKLSYSF